MIQELQLREPSIADTLFVIADFVRSFFGWWYGDIPIYIFGLLGRTLAVLNDRTSFSIILKGFFLPWKNDFNPIGLMVGIVIKSLYLPIISLLFIIIIAFYLTILTFQLILLPTIVGLILINPFLTA